MQETTAAWREGRRWLQRAGRRSGNSAVTPRQRIGAPQRQRVLPSTNWRRTTTVTNGDVVNLRPVVDGSRDRRTGVLRRWAVMLAWCKRTDRIGQQQQQQPQPPCCMARRWTAAADACLSFVGFETTPSSTLCHVKWSTAFRLDEQRANQKIFYDLWNWNTRETAGYMRALRLYSDRHICFCFLFQDKNSQWFINCKLL